MLNPRILNKWSLISVLDVIQLGASTPFLLHFGSFDGLIIVKRSLESAKIRGTSMLTRLLSDVVYEWDCALSVYLSTEWKRLKITSSNPSHVNIRSLKFKVTNGKHWSFLHSFSCVFFKVEMKLYRN